MTPMSLLQFGRSPVSRPAAGPGDDRPPGQSQGRLVARTVAEVALTLGAVVGLVVTGITVAAARSGYQPLVVRSGSMEPTIHTGSMVLVKREPAAEIAVGDIVAVERPDNTRVTHRVVSVVPRGRSSELTLKGDANEDPDPQPVTVTHADRLVFQVPQLGRAMAWLATAQGGFVLGCVVTLVMTAVVRGRRETGKGRTRRRLQRRRRGEG